MGTERPSSRNADDDLYPRLPEKSALPDLYLRPAQRPVRRIRDVVDSLSLPLDDPLGGDNASAAEYAEKTRCPRLHDRLLAPRSCLRHTLCPSAAPTVFSSV